MPPRLPKTFRERWEMWWQATLPGERVQTRDPMEPASHLDQTTQTRISLFPEMSNFLRSRFGLSRETDHQWFPVRPLGKGGFGGVAVWEKRDSLGNVVEETALKQSKWDLSLALPDQQHNAREGAIMYQLNHMNSDYIVFMKAFRCLIDPENTGATWRFYFEYCPYGDLGRLKSRYKAWGTYLPEAFLWRTFHSMAEVARLMKNGKFRELNMESAPTIPCVLIHSDIKPPNIFLGYHAHPKSPWHVYPVVKVGDFGLASLTNHLDPRNPQSFVKNGTAWYLPPESRAKEYRDKYKEWEDPPFDIDGATSSDYKDAEGKPDYSNRKVDSSHNVWGFGLTMHELLTHQEAKVFSDHVNAVTEDEYNAWGRNTIPNLVTKKDPEYSYELRHLVRRCLNLKPSLRPTVEQILEVTGAKIKEYETEVAKITRGATDPVTHAKNTYQLPKLFFKENEINNMPLGPHMQEFGWDDRYLALFAFDEDRYAAPVWGPIQHPNRPAFARYYKELMQQKEEKKQNANRKRVQNTMDPTAVDAAPPKRKKLSEPAQRPKNPYGQSKPARGKLAPNRDKFTRKPPTRRQGGFMAVNTNRGQRAEHEARQQPQGRRLDSVDRALLALRTQASK
ncbi:hypothetical protein EPUS_02894 [Endocarpon pusillum Z07020]|uniref:non-specific serine/threonine protein kinase n=1 Tax=Endocarpon pusillum (strain Z07020 / HMAS-L-300199) TaxID=1263415 RepID=U1GIY7_ENDPU|nr:uncharacterized protein EPUS_02894 [Endocarpon pusillum Z07020]ERF72103.1 hypothetical protein EPUS_02894 [Endocarpon pusillum Z07020]